MLQQHPSTSGVRVGKNRYFFPSDSGKIDLGLGVEAWKGFFTSVRPAYKQLMVNVNVCMTAFYCPGNLADALLAFQRTSMGTMPAKFAQGIKVTTSHLGYKMKKPLKKVMGTPANNTFFECEELGGRVSVEQYFKRSKSSFLTPYLPTKLFLTFLLEYNLKLKYPGNLPVVDIGGKSRSNYLPAELCEIEPGQPYLGKLNGTETANMIRYACNPPAVNADAIVNRGHPPSRTKPCLGTRERIRIICQQ